MYSYTQYHISTNKFYLERKCILLWNLYIVNLIILAFIMCGLSVVVELKVTVFLLLVDTFFLDLVF